MINFFFNKKITTQQQQQTVQIHLAADRLILILKKFRLFHFQIKLD